MKFLILFAQELKFNGDPNQPKFGELKIYSLYSKKYTYGAISGASLSGILDLGNHYDRIRWVEKMLLWIGRGMVGVASDLSINDNCSFILGRKALFYGSKE